MSDLLAGVGRSSKEDSFEAGKEAALTAFKDHGENPEVLLIFCSPRFDHRKLLSGIISVSGEIQMVGGTTAGEIAESGFTTQSVVILALSSKTLNFSTGIGKNMSKNESACSVELAKKLMMNISKKDVISYLVFPNGMGGDGVKVIDGLHSVLGLDAEIVGGFLGDDEEFVNTFQFYNGKVYKDAIPGLMIHGKGKYRTGIGVRSGFESIGNRFYCTESKSNVVKKFDDEIALELYKNFLGEERSKRLPGICLEYPFGLIDDRVSIAGKEYFQLRCGLSVDQKKGTITLAGSIPKGSAITLTTASRGDIINGAKLAAMQAKESLEGAIPKVILMFSCVGRKIVLGRRTNEEVEAVKEVLGRNIPIIGFYTYGEIGPIDKTKKDLSITKFHNETVVLWILGRK